MSPLATGGHQSALSPQIVRADSQGAVWGERERGLFSETHPGTLLPELLTHLENTDRPGRTDSLANV